MAEGKSRVIQETDEEILFYFICEGCGAEGELELEKQDGYKPFACPEGCGATYVPWQCAGVWRLECVVCPIHE